MWKGFAKRALKAVAAIAIVVLSGYVSSYVSRGRCEAYGTAGIVEAVTLPDGSTVPVFPLPNRSRRAAAALQNAGLSLRACVDSEDHFTCFPWADVDSSIPGPFLVAVRWEHVAVPTSGYGHAALFFCFFGLRWPISEHGLWVT